jgi:hypothetical protein
MKEQADSRLRRSIRIPWWVSLVAAICCYCGLKYLVPALHPAIPGWQKLAEAAPSFAPIVTIPLLLLAAKQLYDTKIPHNHGKPEDNNGKNQR